MIRKSLSSDLIRGWKPVFAIPAPGGTRRNFALTARFRANTIKSMREKDR